MTEKLKDTLNETAKETRKAGEAILRGPKKGFIRRQLAKQDARREAALERQERKIAYLERKAVLEERKQTNLARIRDLKSRSGPSFGQKLKKGIKATRKGLGKYKSQVSPKPAKLGQPFSFKVNKNVGFKLR